MVFKDRHFEGLSLWCRIWRLEWYLSYKLLGPYEKSPIFCLKTTCMHSSLCLGSDSPCKLPSLCRNPCQSFQTTPHPRLYTSEHDHFPHSCQTLTLHWRLALCRNTLWDLSNPTPDYWSSQYLVQTPTFLCCNFWLHN